MMSTQVTTHGKTYPSRVTMGALVRFKRITGKDVSQITGQDIAELAQFMYCCVESACKADDVPFDMDFETFADGISLEDFTAFQEQQLTSEGNDGKKKELKKKTLQ